MTTGNPYGLWHMEPALEPDSGTAVVLALDFKLQLLFQVSGTSMSSVRMMPPDLVLELRGVTVGPPTHSYAVCYKDDQYADIQCSA